VPADVHRTRDGLLVAAALVASAGFALGAAATTPFTAPADVMTAVPIAVVTVLTVALWPARPRRPAALRPGPRHPYMGWVFLLAVVVGWELVEYLWRGSRGAHPTLSSMADALDAHLAGKAAAFGAWLWLGAAIVRAGTPPGSRFRRSGTRRA
jgi:hypothetical protein